MCPCGNSTRGTGRHDVRREARHVARPARDQPEGARSSPRRRRCEREAGRVTPPARDEAARRQARAGAGDRPAGRAGARCRRGSARRGDPAAAARPRRYPGPARPGDRRPPGRTRRAARPGRAPRGEPSAAAEACRSSSETSILSPSMSCRITVSSSAARSVSTNRSHVPQISREIAPATIRSGCWFEQSQTRSRAARAAAMSFGTGRHTVGGSSGWCQEARAEDPPERVGRPGVVQPEEVEG